MMDSRQETPRALLTPDEVMQMPAHKEEVMISGVAPILVTQPPDPGALFGGSRIYKGSSIEILIGLEVLAQVTSQKNSPFALG